MESLLMRQTICKHGDILLPQGYTTVLLRQCVMVKRRPMEDSEKTFLHLFGGKKSILEKKKWCADNHINRYWLHFFLPELQRCKRNTFVISFLLSVQKSKQIRFTCVTLSLTVSNCSLAATAWAAEKYAS